MKAMQTGNASCCHAALVTSLLPQSDFYQVVVSATAKPQN